MQTKLTIPGDIKITDLVAFANAQNCELVSKQGRVQMVPRRTCGGFSPLETLRAQGVSCDD